MSDRRRIRVASERKSASLFSAPSLDPERTALARHRQYGKPRAVKVWVLVAQVVIRQQGLKVTVEHHERQQQVLLVPEDPLIEDPMPRVLPGQEYIVEMYDHARTQAGKHSQYQIVHI